MNIRFEQLSAAGLRGLTLLARFGLTIGLARLVSTSDVGLVGLYWAALQLASSLMGLDVYVTTTRQLLQERADRPLLVSRHLGLMSVAGVLLIAIAAILFRVSTPQASLLLLGIFCIHLPLEYYCQEMGRLLIPLGRPLAATGILFVRSAVWVPILFGILSFSGTEYVVETVALVWLSGSLVAAILAAVVVKAATTVWCAPSFQLRWVKAAILSSGVFFLGSLVFRGMLGFDRFFVNIVLGVDAVGVYTVQASVCLGALALLETGIAAWRYPQLVRSIQAGNFGLTRVQLKRFFVDSAMSAVVLLGLIALIFPYAARAFLSAAYTADLTGFYAMAIGVFIFAMSIPYHYVLYGRGQDMRILSIYIISLVLMSAWAFTAMSGMGVAGAGIMLAVALTSIAIGRFALVLIDIRSNWLI